MKNNKGITMISLVLTIIVLLILSSVIIYNSKYQLRMKYVKNLYTDIESINSKVADYYLKNEALPTFENAYLDSKEDLEEMLSIISNNQEDLGINVNDDGEYYVINLSKLDNLTLNYGMDYKNWTDTSTNEDYQDLYIINGVTHQVYYPYGIKLGDEYYFSRNPDEKEVTSITFDDIAEGIEINIINKNYIKLDDINESITANIEVILDEQYNRDSLRYAWSDNQNDENLKWTKFSLDNEDKATLSSLPLNKSVIPHYLFIEVTDINGKRVKNTKTVNKELYAILYSNNADNTDLELVFNSTGELDDSGRTAILQTDNIMSITYTSNANKRPPWYANRAKIKTITIENQIFPRNMAYWFDGCNVATQINTIENLDTSNVTSMAYMLNGCSGLTNLNVSNFDTSNVANMSYMFSGCSGLTNLNLNKFNTSKVTNMSYMFNGCRGLTSLNVNNFDTSKVTTMSRMFKNCSSLTTMDLSELDTNSVKYMVEMFYGCSSLTNINLIGINTSSVIEMNYMFYGCSGLTSLDVTSFNTSKVTNMWGMFNGCSGLTSIDLSSFNTTNVESMQSMFGRCSGLTNIDLTGFNNSNSTTRNVKTMQGMFSNCKSLTSINFGNFNTESVEDMSNMFNLCSELTSLDLSNFDTSQVTDMRNMFYYSGIKNLDLSSFETGNVTDMSYMFKDMKKLETINVSSFDTSKVTTMSEMFLRDSKLQEIDVTNWDTHSVEKMNSVFAYCTGLKNIDVSNWETGNVWDFAWMFREDKNLETLDLSNFDMSKATTVDYMLSITSRLTTIITPKVLPSIDIALTGTYHDSNSNSYTVINSSTPAMIELTK